MNDYRDVGSVGIMEGAFFVSRKELIEWINKSLKLNITKIEQCSNGAIYIQLLDILFPNKSVLNKAKWLAKMEYECIMNYKLIQNVFNKIGIKKQMDVDKLIKGKYQDNLEFLQWFKAFYERIIDYNNENVINYNPIERRRISILGEKGDYKLLNSHLPEWARVDLSSFKDQGFICNETKEHGAIDGLVKSGGTIGMKDTKETAKTGGVSYTQKKMLNRYSVNTDANYIQNARISSSGNTHLSNANCSNRRVKTEKGAHYVSNKELHIPKKSTVSGTRVSVSNKYPSHDSLSSNVQKNNNFNDKNMELTKDIHIIIEQNKKLKLQLEKKSQDIEYLKSKLKEEENERKIATFQKKFYYNKLRFLELLCNNTEENYLLISDIQQIIYARENSYFHQTVSPNEKNDTLNESQNGQELPLEIEHSSFAEQNEYAPVEYESGDEQYSRKEQRYTGEELNTEMDEDQNKYSSDTYKINVKNEHEHEHEHEIENEIETEIGTEKNVDYNSNYS